MEHSRVVLIFHLDTPVALMTQLVAGKVLTRPMHYINEFRQVSINDLFDNLSGLRGDSPSMCFVTK